jgi:hypothetical protein
LNNAARQSTRVKPTLQQAIKWISAIHKKFWNLQAKLGGFMEDLVLEQLGVMRLERPDERMPTAIEHKPALFDEQGRR